MATQFEIDCALMAGHAYLDTRDRLNWFPVPSGWSEFNHQVESGGFEAVSFQRGSEIVISYAGTGPGLTDWDANSGLALGFGSEQLRQAAQYYLEVKAANPGATISFSGHSLGGGLAALMGVLFDEKAVTFDQAPFANSATLSIREDLIQYLNDHGYSNSYLSVLAPELLSFNPYDMGSRVANVTGYFVQGEALQYLSTFQTLGSQTMLEQSSTDLGLSGPISLHSQALLTAFLENNDFRTITFKLPELLKMVFDEALYAYDPSNKDNPQRNFLEHLIRHQSGVIGAFPADAMLTRFTTDLQKIAQDGGFTLTNAHITRTLVAFAMQFYYESAKATDSGKTLFSTDGLTGGIRFDRTDVAAKLSDAKGWNLYFQNYLAEDLTLEEHQIVEKLLPAAIDWFIQAGNISMTATAGDKKSFLLGGIGADWLVGGAEIDLLIGNQGDDHLEGGKGMDTLIGGAGADTYLFNPGDGYDTLLDSGGQGIIKFGELEAKGSATNGLDSTQWIHTPNSNTWIDSQNNITYAKIVVNGETRLLIHHDNNTVLVRGWDDNELGIVLGAGTFAAPAAPTHTGSTAVDRLYGSGGDDLIEGLAESDVLEGGAGNDTLFGNDWLPDLAVAILQGETQAGTGLKGDLLSGDAGRDTLVAQNGNDLLLGGEGEDLIIGGGGNDNINGDGQIVFAYTDWTLTRSVQTSGGTTIYHTDIDNALTFGSPAGAADVIYGGAGEDWINGNQGNDIIDAGADNDAVWGGAGADVILGQGGNDFLDGDGNGTAAEDEGDDYLDGGEGDDTLWGHGGNDSLIGGAGNDKLFGDGTAAEDKGDDYLMGGAGDDFIVGSGGNDTLDGGAGADILGGGAGDDTFLNVDGEDTIFDIEGNNTVILANAVGVGQSGLTASPAPNNNGVELQIALDTGGALKFNSPFFSQGSTTILFANGEEADLETLISENLATPVGLRLDDHGGRLYGGAGGDSLIGGAGNDILNGHRGDDTLTGGSGDDILDGGSGNDHLEGGDGEDSYRFDLGDGQDIIVDQGINLIEFGIGIDLQDISVARVEHGYLISYSQSGDAVTVPLDWALQRNRVRFADGTFVLSNDLFADLPQPDLLGADFADSLGSLADDAWLVGKTTQVLGTDAADTLVNTRPNVRFAGGKGDDVLVGGAGGNVYVLNRGDGFDAVVDLGGTDTIQFGPGITPANLWFSHEDNGDGFPAFRINVEDWGVGLTIKDGELGAIEYFAFSDGTRLSFAELAAMNNWSAPLANEIPATGFHDIVQSGPLVAGTPGDDALYGSGTGDAVFVPGAGNDLIDADGGGRNVYILNEGDGEDILYDDPARTNETLVLGDGITPDGLSFEIDSWTETIFNPDTGLYDTRHYRDLTIHYGNQGDTLLVYDGAGASQIERLLFANGKEIQLDVFNSRPDGIYTLAQLSTPLQTPVGTAGDFAIPATPHAEPNVHWNGTEGDDQYAARDLLAMADAPPLPQRDVANGGAGNDIIATLSGNDLLWGGAGDDVLEGGTGSDVYLFAAGDGHDVIREEANADDRNYIVIDGTGMLSGAPQFDFDGTSLTIRYNGGTDEIVVENFQPGGAGGESAISGVRVVGNYGAYYDLADVLDIQTANQAPQVAIPIPDQLASENISFSYALPANAITDPDAGDTLVFGATLADGTDLPTWLAFDPASLTFSGIPPVGVTGTFSVMVTATDSGNLSASDVFDIFVGMQDIVIIGSPGNDVLAGGSGSDWLDGGAGADRMTGGAGDDVYVVDNSGDKVVESQNQGWDEVASEIGYTLPANVEGLTLQGDSNINASGNALDNELYGNAGNNTLNGKAGADFMAGGLGNDVYVVDDEGDIVSEYLDEGVDRVNASVSYALGDHLENLTLTGTDAIDGTGNDLDNIIRGNAADNILIGGAGNDTLYGSGMDTLIGGTGDDIYVVGNSDVQVIEQAGEGIDLVKSSVDFALSAEVEDLTLTGSANINGFGNDLDNTIKGNAADNYLAGLGGADTLRGNGSSDILQGGAGSDLLYGGTGPNLLDGGADDDVLTGNTGSEMFIGGAGNDAITTGTGADLILFNRGDGQDVVNASLAADNTLSLGGEIHYEQMTLSKSGNDLVLDMGEGDQVSFRNWYRGNHSVATLQIVLDGSASYQPGGTDALLDNMIESFDFNGLVSAFDAARTATPTLTTWSLTNALTSFHLGGSDTEALGGDLAYQYGKYGNLANVGVNVAQSLLSDAAFGTGAQALKPPADLQAGAVRLM